MNTKPSTDFSHLRPSNTSFRGEGLRDFFEYDDIGIADETKGRIVAQLVRTKNAPQAGTEVYP
jgi:hypothetical protein